MKPRHWYHCTDQFRGEHWTVRGNGRPVFVGAKEPTTPRLAVCPTVAACFAARMFHHGTTVYVYRTRTPRRTNKPVNVYDAVITGERWLVPPVVMEHMHTIPAGVVSRACWWVYNYLQMMQRAPDAVGRLRAYTDAVNVLSRFDPSFVSGFDRRFSSRAYEYFVNNGTGKIR